MTEPKKRSRDFSESPTEAETDLLGLLEEQPTPSDKDSGKGKDGKGKGGEDPLGDGFDAKELIESNPLCIEGQAQRASRSKFTTAVNHAPDAIKRKIQQLQHANGRTGARREMIEHITQHAEALQLVSEGQLKCVWDSPHFQSLIKLTEEDEETKSQGWIPKGRLEVLLGAEDAAQAIKNNRYESRQKTQGGDTFMEYRFTEEKTSQMKRCTFEEEVATGPKDIDSAAAAGIVAAMMPSDGGELPNIAPRWTYDKEAFLFLKKCGMGKYAKRISSAEHCLRYCQLRNLTLADCTELGVEKKDRKKLLRRCRKATGCKEERTCRVCGWWVHMR